MNPTRISRLFERLRASGRAGLIGYITAGDPTPEATPDLVAALDILVMSSYTESFPNAILEAMAMGKPVVATNVGGIPELIEEGQTGFLVPPRDPKAIADRVLSLCRDSARRLQMGRAARARVESNFTVQAVTARLEGIYARSLRERFGSA